MPTRSRKKQKQRSRRSVAMEKTLDRMKVENVEKLVDVSMDKTKHPFHSGCLCHNCIDEELRNIPEKEVNDKEQWIEDFKPIYQKALLNPNKKNKLIIKKFITSVYAFADLKMRYDRNKKINVVLSRMTFPSLIE